AAACGCPLVGGGLFTLEGCTLPPPGRNSPEAKGGSKGAPTPPRRPPRTPGAHPTRRPQLWPALQGSSRFPRSLTGHLADWTPARFPAFSTGTRCVCRRRRRDVRNKDLRVLVATHRRDRAVVFGRILSWPARGRARRVGTARQGKPSPAPRRGGDNRQEAA